MDYKSNHPGPDSREFFRGRLLFSSPRSMHKRPFKIVSAPLSPRRLSPEEPNLRGKMRSVAAGAASHVSVMFREFRSVWTVFRGCSVCVCRVGFSWLRDGRRHQPRILRHGLGLRSGPGKPRASTWKWRVPETLWVYLRGSRRP